MLSLDFLHFIHRANKGRWERLPTICFVNGILNKTSNDIFLFPRTLHRNSAFLPSLQWQLGYGEIVAHVTFFLCTHTTYLFEKWKNSTYAIKRHPTYEQILRNVHCKNFTSLGQKKKETKTKILIINHSENQ